MYDNQDSLAVRLLCMQKIIITGIDGIEFSPLNSIVQLDGVRCFSKMIDMSMVLRIQTIFVYMIRVGY